MTPPEIKMAEKDILTDVLRQLSIKLRFSLELKVEQRDALNSLLDWIRRSCCVATGY